MLARSVVERSIETAKKVFEYNQLRLPVYANWTVEDWKKSGEETREVEDCMLGWDVTDFGSGKFEEIGRTLFTLRNGRPNDSRYPKSFAEKLILDPEGQRAPAHYHRNKREDIINRGGGFIVLELTKADKDGNPDKRGTLQVAVDGITKTMISGDRIILKPGESLCIHPGIIHQFWGEGGNGLEVNGVLYGVSGEISSICDDHKDNAFLAGHACRFPEIVPDCPQKHVLCNEYEGIKNQQEERC